MRGIDLYDLRLQRLAVDMSNLCMNYEFYFCRFNTLLYVSSFGMFLSHPIGTDNEILTESCVVY